MPLLEVRDLQKRYGEKTVLHGTSFEIHEGEIFCLLGPNGAGKSTTINILTGALCHDGGTLTYGGNPIGGNLRAFKRDLGVVPQDICLYEDLSAARNVLFFASLYGLRGEKLKTHCREALAFAGLSDRADDIVKTFSGGMKRRLNIACAIAHRPRLLIMDEPTVGIDPQSRNHILDSIKKLRDEGMTVLYTTHYMEEVEEISTRIVIMDTGRVIAEGTSATLKSDIADGPVYSIETEDAIPDESGLLKMEGVRKVQVIENGVRVAAEDGFHGLDKIIAALAGQGVKIAGLTTETPSLETVFLRLTGKSLRD